MLNKMGPSSEMTKVNGNLKLHLTSSAETLDSNTWQAYDPSPLFLVMKPNNLQINKTFRHMKGKKPFEAHTLLSYQTSCK